MARMLNSHPALVDRERSLNRRITRIVAKGKPIGIGMLVLEVGGEAVVTKDQDAYEEVRSRLVSAS